MISGFSNSPTHLFEHLSFDSSMPMPFKIPAVMQVLLNPEIDLDYTAKQKDLIEAIRFSVNAKVKMFQKVGVRENELRQLMLQEGQNTAALKEEYDEIQTEKIEASEIFFDLINALADLLEPYQYESLLQKAGINLG